MELLYHLSYVGTKNKSSHRILRNARDSKNDTILRMDEHYTHHHHRPPHKHLVRYFRDNIAIVFGIVIMWRSIWIILDAVDAYLFGNNQILMAIPWMILGLLILYLPDKDLKELQKL